MYTVHNVIIILLQLSKQLAQVLKACSNNLYNNNHNDTIYINHVKLNLLCMLEITDQ